MDDQKAMAQLIDWAVKLSDEELRKVIDFLHQELKTRFNRAAQAAALALKPGVWVEVLKGARKLAVGTRGHIVEIRRNGRVDVHFPDLEGLWTVTATILRKVDGPPPGASKGCGPH